MNPWIQQDTGGGCVCIGFTLPDGESCLILTGDVVGIYGQTAEAWFRDGGDEEKLEASLVFDHHQQLRDFIRRDEPRHIGRTESEIAGKWAEVFGADLL